MIQRIQSIWFFLAAICLLLLLFIPLVSQAYSTTNLSLFISGIHHNVDGKSIQAEPFTGLLAGTIGVALLALVTIFLFRNRTLQKRIATVVILLIVALCGWIFQIIQQLEGGLAGVKVEPGVALPVLAILFMGLGIRAINKDEQLIRSADRLR